MLTIKNVKHSVFASQETNCFEATVYWNGKKAGYAENSGRGGCTDIHWLNRDAEKEAITWAKTQPDIVTDLCLQDSDEIFTYTFDLEGAIDELLETHLAEKELKTKLKTKLLIKDDNSNKDEFHSWTFKKYKFSKEQLIEGVLKKANLVNPIVLNLLPLNEALKIWRGKA
tara:strand:+ start:373 stop:882 length:510 start_codon:yes stop_codon:yes gene_type:complete